ncbi:MAG: SDR family oxidoreductase [Hyphomonadaceae bacterium]
MKWALVTGGAKRLGKACALELARAGWNIAIQFNSSREAAEATVAEIQALGRSAAGIECDLSRTNAPMALIDTAMQATQGQLRALVNCAALFEHDTPERIDPDLFARHMQVNALAPAMLASAFANAAPKSERLMVVNFLDFKLAAPYPDHFSYTMSKYALMGATEMLARALAPHVRVNAVAPGYVLPAPGQSEDDFKRLHDEATPLKNGATPEDVAKAVRYLIESPAVTGQTIYVDSGLRFLSHERDFAFR